METKSSGIANIEDLSFTHELPVDDTKENISILSVVDVGVSESKFLEICKFKKDDSTSSDMKKTSSSIILLDGSLENVSNIHHKPNKHSTVSYAPRTKRSCRKTSFSTSSTRKKIAFKCSTEKEDRALHLSNFNRRKGWTIFPADVKSNFGRSNQNNVSTENIENTSDDYQSEDETLTELPKKIFSLISESIVKCTLCFKQMKLSSMRQHYRTHTGIKPFKCQFCANRFTRNADLHRHISSLHPRRKPLNLQCLVCAKYFIDKKSLICHLKSHNSAMYLICHICGHKFKHKTYFQNHLKFVHSLSSDVSNSEVYQQALKQIKELQAQDPEKNVEVTEYQHQIDKSDQSNEDSSDEDCDNLHIKIKEEPNGNTYDNNDSDLERDDPVPASSSGTCISDFSSPLTPSCKVLLTPMRNGTLNLVQKGINSEDSEEEELIAKAIAEHVIQAENTIENIQLSLNQSEDPLNMKEYETTKNREINCNISPQDKLISEPKSSEIHISASVDNKLQKFILRVPSGRLIDATTQKGMEALVNIVRDLYAGKGELSGNIDVTLHHNIA